MIMRKGGAVFLVVFSSVCILMVEVNCCASQIATKLSCLHPDYWILLLLGDYWMLNFDLSLIIIMVIFKCYFSRERIAL